MRPEEVFTIQKENVHLKRRYLFVPSGKTRFARRNVPLTDATVRLLKSRLAKAKGPFVFAHRRDANRPLTTIHEAHLEAVKASKAKSPFRLYDLRHTFGSRSAMAGVDLARSFQYFDHDAVRSPDA